MKHKTHLLVCLTVLLSSIQFESTSFGASGFMPFQQQAGLERLRANTKGALSVTQRSSSERPTFLSGRMTVPQSEAGRNAGSVATGFLTRYSDLFGIDKIAHELEMTDQSVDALGFTRVVYQQKHRGVPVMNAQVRIHLNTNRSEVLAVSNGFKPNISVDIESSVNMTQALTTAQRALRSGQLTNVKPRLVIVPAENANSVDRLAWWVDLLDITLPARNIYLIDAQTGSFINSLSILYFARDRKTYDAKGTRSLPGTLARSEGETAVGDKDVDNAHDFAGATYDYFKATHGRDSYDNNGASLISTANYGVNYPNAFWNGNQMTYGDDFAVKDVAAHELTHAVTERTAGLEYVWQSGALNESMSDVFGAMVDRDDWLMGEDIPSDKLGGREAIRDLENPTRLGQPDHTKDWVKTCSDNEGVHTNSGITNKAFYNIATAIGKDKAEKIFYRTLTVYLQPTSSLEDARAKALQSAQDIYGTGSAEFNAVQAGFGAVGLDGVWNPPTNDCSCLATVVLGASLVFNDALDAIESAAILYRARDQLLGDTPVGRYYRDLYYSHTARMSMLTIRDASLRQTGASVIKQLTPGLEMMMNGNGNQPTLTTSQVLEMRSYLLQMARADRQLGDGALAATIEREMFRFDWDKLDGMTYDQAWAYVQSGGSFVLHNVFLPVVER